MTMFLQGSKEKKMESKMITKYMTIEEAARLPNMLGILASRFLQSTGEYYYTYKGERICLKLVS